MTTIAQRSQHVIRMRTSFALEGMYPSADDAALQAQYISGKTTLLDMLAHARSYALQRARTFVQADSVAAA